MATRGQLRDAIMTEIRDATSIQDNHVYLYGSRDDEPLPAVAYNDTAYRRIVFNGVGKSPNQINRNSSGEILTMTWREYIQAQFIIDVRASSEIDKESHYEDIRSHFGEHQFPGLGEISGNHYKDVHSDIIDIEVIDARNSDSNTADDPIRGDQIELHVTFFRDYTLESDLEAGGGVGSGDFPVMDQINLEVDADLDDQTTGLTYTVT